MSHPRISSVLGLTGLLLVACDASPQAEEAAAKSDARAELHGPAASPTVSGSDAKAEDAAAPSPGSIAPAAPSGAGEAGGDGRAAAFAEEASASADKGSAGLSALGEADGDDEYRAEPRRQLPPPGAGRLTAGRWSDRDDWSRWQGLLAYGSSYGGMLDAWSLTHPERIAVTLRGRDRLPADATLVLEDAYGQRLWQARADNRGRAELFLPAGQSGRLSVRAADGRTLATREVRAGEQHELRIDEDVAVASALDLMFVVDTTGSMGDELSYLQTELTDIVDRVQRNSAQSLSVRTSVNFFKDQGDSYVVRSFPFTAELPQTLGHLRAEHASGGGDYPEALDMALANAVHEHQWSDSAVARIMFVVTDAPPHSGHDVGQRLQQTAAAAAAKGIRIVPIASSGVDKPTEFVLRHLAVSTGGTYVFLTDHSGIGNAHIEPTVGPYVVAPLNDLLVEVIGEYTSSEQLSLTAPLPFATTAAGVANDAPCGYAMSHMHDDGDDWQWWAAGLAFIPALLGGLWWLRGRRVRIEPVSDARVARARRMLAELERRGRGPRPSEARSWATEMREVVDGMEQLAQQQQAIDASLRVAGAQVDDPDPTGMRAALRAEVMQRRATIDAEIDAGLVSVEAAYLHVIGGVGERATALARLDSAREALQTRIEVEREFRVDR